jgi:hypothetical protein
VAFPGAAKHESAGKEEAAEKGKTAGKEAAAGKEDTEDTSQSPRIMNRIINPTSRSFGNSSDASPRIHLRSLARPGATQRSLDLDLVDVNEILSDSASDNFKSDGKPHTMGGTWLESKIQTAAENRTNENRINLSGAQNVSGSQNRINFSETPLGREFLAGRQDLIRQREELIRQREQLMREEVEV